MFTAALFREAKAWRQPERPSTEARMKKTCYIYTMEKYSTIRKNEIAPPLATTWMNLENSMASEISQTEKIKNRMISLICGI